MGILFFISIAALLALLWAAFSIAQHVRRARRRQRNAIQAVAATKIEQTVEMDALKPDSDVVRAESEANASAHEGVIRSTASPRELSEVRYPASGILGSTFTGRSPKI